jgi:hypothetical protein
MKTTLEIIDTLWSHINNSSLKSAINGQICKQKRPISSKAEDVVINCLAANNEQLQTAIVNVNIYVPNVTVRLNGAVDTSQPNMARLETLAVAAGAILDDQWVDDYNFSVQQQLVIEDQESTSHYINFRIEYYSINILN